MIMTMIQTIQIPTAQENNVSEKAEESESPEINAAGLKVRLEQATADRANITTIVLLIVYALLSGAIALSSFWTIRANNRLRIAENLLNNLQVAKVKADALHKIEVDTDRVRHDAANALQIGTDKVRQEAKTEQTRIETEAAQKLADTKAGLVREQNKLAIEQQKVADAQRVTAEAQKDAARTLLNAQFNLQQIRSLHMPRHLVRGENREKFMQALEGKPVAVIDIKWAGDMFIGEPRQFAEEISEALKEAGWTITKVEGVIIMNDPDPLNLKIPAGLKIFVRDLDNIPASAQALHWAFLSSGLVAEIARNERLDGDALGLMVFMIPADGGRVLRFAPK